MPPFFNKKSVIIATAIIVLLIGAIAYSQRDKGEEIDFVVAERKDLVQEVSVTGRVQSADQVDLAFDRSGKVARVNVKVGDSVRAGQTLVVLQNLDLLSDLNRARAGVESAQAQLSQYHAALAAQQAKLDELKSGTRPEELRVYETKTESARTALQTAKQSLLNSIRDAFTKSDDSIRNKADQLFNVPRSSMPQLKFFTDQQREVDLEGERMLFEQILNQWSVSASSLSAAADLLQAQNQAHDNLDRVMRFLDKLGFAVNNVTPNADLAQTTVDSWKTDVASARTNANTAKTNLIAAEEKVRAAESSMAVAVRELQLKQAGSTPEQIAVQEAGVRQAVANVTYQEAQVRSAQANVQSAGAQLAKTVIAAPFAGIVSAQEAKLGEIVSPNTTIISIISPAEFEIEANVPEADIAKLSLGDTARVTLDAYGSDVVFAVKVAAIDPAETIIDGVATYRVTFQFTSPDERVKSGMTANIDISTERRDNVIAIPQRAVIARNGKKFVRILDGETEKEVEVETGLRGSSGNIEIISGLNEGEKVIVEFE